jgi:hypothetical protein
MHLPDPPGKAIQRKAEPPLNVVTQYLADVYVSATNLKLHMSPKWV